MKKHNLTRILLLIILLSTVLTACSPPKTGGDQNAPLKGTITISGAWALYPLVIRWGEEFQKIPQINTFTTKDLGGWAIVYSQLLKPYWEKEILPALSLDEESSIINWE